MTRHNLNALKDILLRMKTDILMAADKHYKEDIKTCSLNLPDEIDSASIENNSFINMRIRNRERLLLRKIETALNKMEYNEYGICEECDENIGFKRLVVRPVTSLCIACKEDQEQREKQYWN